METKFAMKDLISQAQAISKKKIAAIRTEGGGEFTSNNILSIYSEEQIHKQITPPYSPEANGRAERGNRTVFEMARILLSEFEHYSGLKNYATLWPEAI